MRKRTNNPYYALLADENFYEGDYSQAINLKNSVHEFYVGLAKVHYMLKDNVKAQQYIKKAIAEVTSHNLIINTSETKAIKTNALTSRNPLNMINA